MPLDQPQEASRRELLHLAAQTASRLRATCLIGQRLIMGLGRWGRFSQAR